MLHKVDPDEKTLSPMSYSLFVVEVRVDYCPGLFVSIVMLAGEYSKFYSTIGGNWNRAINCFVWVFQDSRNLTKSYQRICGKSYRRYLKII